MERSPLGAGADLAVQLGQCIREIGASETEYVCEIRRQRTAIIEGVINRRGNVLLVLVEAAAYAELSRKVEKHISRRVNQTAPQI